MKDPLTNESIFEKIDSCNGELSKEETQSLVESIISLMESRNITYDCAYKVLDATKTTLSWMSHRLTL